MGLGWITPALTSRRSADTRSLSRRAIIFSLTSQAAPAGPMCGQAAGLRERPPEQGGRQWRASKAAAAAPQARVASGGLESSRLRGRRRRLEGVM